MQINNTSATLQKYISAILYTLLLVTSFAFYGATADVFDSIIEKNHAEKWFNDSGTLIISLLVWLGLTYAIERRIKRNPSILEFDVVRKVLLTITSTLFFIIPIYVVYRIFDQYLHGEYKIGFYAIQFLKLFTAGVIGSYFLLALKRHAYDNNFLFRELGILIVLEGLVLFSINLYNAPSIDDLRMQRKDEAKLEHLRKGKRLVEDYLRQHKYLPKALSDITLPEEQSIKAFRDPVSEKPFTYVVLSEHEGAICTEFHTKTQDKYVDHTIHPISKNPKEKCLRMEKPKDEDNLKSLGSY